MKNIQNKLIALLFIALVFPHFGTSQDRLLHEPSYEVNQVYPYICITKDELNKAKTLIDLNSRYQATWVKEYISVEIEASHKGKTTKVVSQNDVLSQAQKKLIHTADAGTDISVNVQYMPKNTLKHNEAKEIKFTVAVNPDNQAKYAGGQQQLKQYLKEKAINKIPAGIFKDYKLAAVKFTINEKGQVINAHIFESSKDEKVDELLLNAINQMSNWKPATYANGVKVKQDFVLTVGNHKSCVINLLSIHRNGPAKRD